MLVLNGGIRLWRINNVSYMRLGKYAFFQIAKVPEALWFVEQIGRLYLIGVECLMWRLSAKQIKNEEKNNVDEILKGLRKKVLKM
ncbi:hypothetical protein SAMN05444349_1622 [Bacteroides faecichinchillae]|uniref:Uncharacterized protein n=1 Tax=Bacteroides faecichinchillae TaxID=871325 RepID=A0A1M5GGG6_9BACE|nr:hypothetical protein [Bacteroides faecichinchillae]THG59864.1 hypothetical protein E5981_15270 [Bacteroides faecichinchillae]SHG02591.1 hypothetical protein SAMN05444349_1622 [Bacteroides faecichinchillae]